MGKMKAHIVKPKEEQERAKIAKLVDKYKTFEEVKDDIAQQMVAIMLYAYHLKGYRKKRINEMFETFISTNNTPAVFGHQLESVQVMDFISKKYGIDFSRVSLETESETEYLARMLKND